MNRLLIIASQWYFQFFEKFKEHVPDTEFNIRIIPSAICEFAAAPFAHVPSPRVLKILNDFKPDVILTDYTGLPNWWAKIYKFSVKRNIPLIFRLRGDWWTESSGRHNYYDTWLQKFGFLAWVRPMKGFSMKFPDLILPMCKWLNEKVHKKLPNSRTKVIYQGVDTDEWFFDPGFENIDEPSVGIFQDSNVPLKTRGLIWFTKVIRNMRDTNFYIAGGGKYMRLVRNRCSGLKNVHFLNRLTPKEGRRFLSTVDVYVLPTGLDCCPTTVLEASSVEKPSIASRVGGVPELILEGKNGWTIKNDQTTTWEERIRILIEDKNLAKRMGQNARIHVSNNFSWQVISKQLISILKQEIPNRK